jgi:hypothetical protein
MNADSRKARTLMAVLWPSFLMAGVLEALVFAMVDPSALHWFGGAPVKLSASAVYTLAFFIFWAVIAGASGMTQLLAHSAEEINSRSFR